MIGFCWFHYHQRQLKVRFHIPGNRAWSRWWARCIHSRTNSRVGTSLLSQELLAKTLQVLHSMQLWWHEVGLGKDTSLGLHHFLQWEQPSHTASRDQRRDDTIAAINHHDATSHGWHQHSDAIDVSTDGTTWLGSLSALQGGSLCPHLSIYLTTSPCYRQTCGCSSWMASYLDWGLPKRLLRYTSCCVCECIYRENQLKWEEPHECRLGVWMK